MKSLNLLSIAIVALLIFGACKNQGTTQDTEEGAASVEEQLKAFRSKVAEVLPDLSDPGDIAGMIEMTGADYVPSLVHDASLAEKYMDNADLAGLNLGIYTADLAYTTTFRESEQSWKTLTACQTLANQLGMGETYLQALTNYYENVIENKDTLIYLLEQETGSVIENFENSDRKRLYTAFAAGMVIENLWLSTGIIDTYPDDMLPEDAKALVLREMVLVVLAAEKELDLLITAIEEVQTEEDPGVLIAELKDLKASFEKLEIENTIATATPNTILTNQNLEEITAKVTAIRNGLIATE